MKTKPKTLPWFKFYPSDWRADQALRICSIAARGLWMEMLCIMHEAEPYGHLIVNGVPLTETHIAALTGVPQVEVGALLTDLESAGVFSRNRDGVIYSRRMIRDEKKKKDGEKSSKNGKIPGSRRYKQATDKQEEKRPPPRVARGVESRPPPHPETRGQRPERQQLQNQCSESASADDVVVGLVSSFGTMLTATGMKRGEPERFIREWLNDMDAENLRQLLTAASNKRDPVAYIAGAIRNARAEAGRPPENPSSEIGVALKAWLKTGRWTGRHGHPPGSGRCTIDADILARLEPPGGWPKPVETVEGEWINPEAKAA